TSLPENRTDLPESFERNQAKNGYWNQNIEGEHWTDHDQQHQTNRRGQHPSHHLGQIRADKIADTLDIRHHPGNQFTSLGTVKKTNRQPNNMRPDLGPPFGY